MVQEVQEVQEIQEVQEVQQKLVRFKCAHGTMVHTELFLDSTSHLCWMET